MPGPPFFTVTVNGDGVTNPIRLPMSGEAQLPTEGS